MPAVQQGLHRQAMRSTMIINKQRGDGLEPNLSLEQLQLFMPSPNWGVRLRLKYTSKDEKHFTDL
jgi:hypothetical protein